LTNLASGLRLRHADIQTTMRHTHINYSPEKNSRTLEMNPTMLKYFFGKENPLTSN